MQKTSNMSIRNTLCKSPKSERRILQSSQNSEYEEPTEIISSSYLDREEEEIISSIKRFMQVESGAQTSDNEGNYEDRSRKIELDMSLVPINICEICFQQVQEKRMKSIDRCSHLFCFSCLESHIKERLSQSQTVVPCPAEECKESLKQVSPIYNELEDSTKRMFRKKEGLNFILKNPGFQLCKRDECEGKFKISKDKNGNKCDICSADHCLKCFDLKHSNTCNKDLVAHLQNKQFFRQCKKCKFVIEKTHGCNHITCLCEFQFCYYCGEQFVLGHSCQNIRISLIEQLHRSLLTETPRFFEHKSLNLRSAFRYFQLQPEMRGSHKLIKFLTFILFAYPMLLFHGILILMVLIPIFIAIIGFFFFFLPFGNIGDNDVFGESIQYHIGKRSLFLACIFVVLFYPLLLLHISIVYLVRICQWFYKKLCNLPYFGGSAYELSDSFWIGIKITIQYITITLVLPCLII